MNVLISSAGRRVGLIECIRTSLDRLGLPNSKIIAADACDTAPTSHIADVAALLPPCLEAEFVPSLKALCREQAVDLIVPTIDTELPVLAGHRQQIEEVGARLWLSCPETIEITADKRKMNGWLMKHGFPTVQQYSPASALEAWRDSALPLLAKPVRGSASLGVKFVSNTSELEALLDADQTVIESVAPGVEYTVHVWANAEGRATCAVPCERLEVRAGEVSKGRTVKHHGLMQLAKDIVETLPGSRGPINVQIFLDVDGQMNVIEVNPRFGGGYPLVERAGASFTGQLLGDTAPLSDNWTDGLTMLRYDAAVYVPAVI
jgi:carbamoyl-phosphate synthase large subunit